MSLEKYSINELEDEINNRRFSTKIKPFEGRKDLSDKEKAKVFDDLYEYIIKDLKHLIHYGYNSKDAIHYSYEELYEKIMGKDIWDLVNSSTV